VPFEGNQALYKYDSGLISEANHEEGIATFSCLWLWLSFA